MTKQIMILLAALTVMACGGDPRDTKENIRYRHGTLVSIQDSWLGTIYDTCYNHNQECRVVPAGIQGIHRVNVDDIKEVTPR